MVLFTLLASMAHAGAVEEGAAAFSQGELDRAITAWESATAEGGQPSGVISYDLGIAWYRKGDFPRSVARFRGASHRRPRDGNVLHNLALARSGLGMVPTPVLDAGWTQVATPNEVATLGVLLAAAGSLGLLFGRRLSLPPGGGTLLLAAGVGIGWLGTSEARWQREHPVAVIVDGEVAARDAPNINAGERHRWPVGTETRVEREHDGFLLLLDGRERRGWVAKNAVELAW